MAVKVALDAGHGGTDFGATYNSRAEKDDTLKLTKAIGEILRNKGVEVFYTRDSDIYETPFKKATDANVSGADYFVSIHRNSSTFPNQYSGIQSIVYDDSGVRAQLARNINEELEKVGYNNIGVEERTNLVVLRRTNMPAVLVEVGFINTDKDNELFDNQFEETANAIAEGILNTIGKTDTVEADNSSNAVEAYNDTSNISTYSQPSTNPAQSHNYIYRIQVGAFQNKDNADRMLNSLLIEGFPAYIIYENGFYKVQVGSYDYLESAIKMEQRLRRFGYNTFIIYD